MRATLFGAAVALVLLLAGCAAGERAAPRTYRMGDRVELGRVIYNVFETQRKLKLGDGPGEVLPRNRFLLVRVSMSNSGNTPLMAPALTLVDDQNQTHSEFAGTEAVPQWLGIIRQIGPVESLQGNIAFDVAPAHYRLQVSDQDESRTALIDLPLAYNSDWLPKPAQ